MTMPASETPLLEIRGLSVEFRARRGEPVQAVQDLSLTARAGECVVVLGESGSGKSVTAKAVMGLLEGTARTTAGSIRLGGVDLLADPAAMRAARGRDVAMVFQDSLSALNPVQRVGDQIAEMFRVHQGLSKTEARARAIELMRRVAIPDPERRARSYPHQISGGMRQRIVIAMAITLEPRLLIADEPTTALDVTVQKGILDLFRVLTDAGAGLVFITHDIGVAAEIADHIVVMYAGSVMETGPAREVLAAPHHPYTRALLASVPRIEQPGARRPIPGGLPDPADRPAGCLFAPRCPLAAADCTATRPALESLEPGRAAACLRITEVQHVLAQ
ncbi:ABC transporter ATP-binding protein [Streptosporangium sp. NPDC006007]|uniref:ABC transporter ATP-binding protein n=1 Tax=Streptosporangium sp. NPDC006007 TaxID=3154575 RepID=UPI0033A61D19